ncbi:MAG TPA: hypothetical protein VF505_16005 [Thermoanaerobaculia bacterium]
MLNRRSFIVAAFALCLSATSFADVPSRPANPQELAVIERVVHAIDATFDKFADSNWQQRSASDHEAFEVALDPDHPLNFALQCDREFEIRPGSTLFNAKVKPIQDALLQTSDVAKMAALGKQIDGNTSFSIEAEPNNSSIPAEQAELAHDLGAKGATFSFCQSGEQLDCYVVFGDTSKWKPYKTGGRDFVFAHPKHTPAVENLSIRFHAKNSAGMAADRIHELIRTTNWTPIQESLTK